MKTIIINKIIKVRPGINLFESTVLENGEKYKYISQDKVHFTKYKLMNKLYIRQKE